MKSMRRFCAWREWWRHREFPFLRTENRKWKIEKERRKWPRKCASLTKNKKWKIEIGNYPCYAAEIRPHMPRVTWCALRLGAIGNSKAANGRARIEWPLSEEAFSCRK